MAVIAGILQCIADRFGLICAAVTLTGIAAENHVGGSAENVPYIGAQSGVLECIDGLLTVPAGQADVCGVEIAGPAVIVVGVGFCR